MTELNIRFNPRYLSDIAWDQWIEALEGELPAAKEKLTEAAEDLPLLEQLTNAKAIFALDDFEDPLDLDEKLGKGAVATCGCRWAPGDVDESLSSRLHRLSSIALELLQVA